jgi:hypothetical protein
MGMGMGMGTDHLFQMRLDIGGGESEDEDDKTDTQSPDPDPDPDPDPTMTMSTRTELEIPTAAFMESLSGIPVEYFNPIEANCLETSVLADGPHALDMLHYLRNGYAVYLRWLKDKARIVGLSTEWDDYLTFTVARDINRHSHAHAEDSPMGHDIDLIALVHSFPDDEKNVIHLAQKCDATPESIHTALSRDPTMDTDDFYVRLKRVSERALDAHSRKTWRGTEGTVSSGDFVLSLIDLEAGRCVAPACGFHLGLKMLEDSGFVDPPETPTVREYRRSRNIMHHN